MAIGKLLFWVIVLVVVVALVAGGPAVLAKVPELREKAREVVTEKQDKRGQSGSQISGVEFARARHGMTPSQLRSRVGNPETTSDTALEGLEVECWYYGIAGASGSYQFCFANGKLALKFRYVR